MNQVVLQNRVVETLAMFLGAFVVCLILRPGRSLLLNAVWAVALSAACYLLLSAFGPISNLWRLGDNNLIERAVVFFIGGGVGAFVPALVLRVLRGVFFRQDNTAAYASDRIGNTPRSVRGCTVTFNILGQMVSIGDLPVVRDMLGRIVQIGNMPVAYGPLGRIVQIGVVPINYGPLGKVTTAGEMPVMYGPLGRVIQVGNQPIEYTMLGQFKTLGSLVVHYNMVGRIVALTDKSGSPECMLTRQQIMALLILLQQRTQMEKASRRLHQRT